MLNFLIVLSLIQLIHCSIDSDLQIDGLFPPDIDHDWRFNWNAFPTKFPLSSKYIQRGELFPLDAPKKTNKIEPERKTFMDFASMLPIPNAEALMAASGVSMLQNVASASMPNIPKMVSSFFNIKNMFNNNRNPNQLLPLLRSRAYKLPAGKTENDHGMVFGKREVSQTRRRNVTRRFKRPIVVAPLNQNAIENEVNVKEINKTNIQVNERPVSKELDSMERHTFVNSDFVGIPSPVGYQNKNPSKMDGFVQKNDSNRTKEERLSTKLPVKGRFVLKNPLETTVSTSYRSGSKNLFKSPPVMENKFFTTSLRDLFQLESNREENQKNNNKIVIITDDDVNDSKRTRMARQRSRIQNNRPQTQPLVSRKPIPTELPVYIQEQRQMTGMHPPPIQIPNIFMGEDEAAENDVRPTYKNDISETKICEHRRKPKKTTTKPTKNPVHSSVMDIITNHATEPPNMNQNNNWSYSPPIPLKKPQKSPQQVQKAVVSTSTPTSYMEMTHEFDSWRPQTNEDWAPNLPPFKQLPLSYPSDTNMDMVTGAGNAPPYYGSNNYEDEENDEEDDMEFPAETKKVVRVMMPEVKFPNQKISQPQFQLQSQQFQKKPPVVMNPYSGFPGTASNIEQQRYPSPHMMLNDGLLFQRYNLLKEIEQMQSNLFGANGDDETFMASQMPNSMLHSSPMMSNPIMSSPLIASPVQSMTSSVANSGPVMFSGNPSPGGPSMKSGSFSQKGKPLKLMKFRVL